MYKNIKYILKQNGIYEDYDISKLQSAIKNALKSVNEYSERDGCLDVTAKILSQFISDKLDNVLKDDQPEIDYVSSDSLTICICDELFGAGYTRTAQTYMINKYLEALAEKDKVITSLKNELKLYKEGENNDKGN